MKDLNFKEFSTLLHTDWHPKKGDFVKEHSLNDSAQFKERMRKRNIIIGSLVAGIMLVFAIAIIVLST